MIERVEVLQDGASSIYGSDAIAGVVNIITSRNQDGFLASAQLGSFGEGDGFTQNYQLSWGSGNGDSRPRSSSAAVTSSRRRSARSSRDISLFPTPGADRLRRQLQLGHAARPLHRASAQDLTLSPRLSAGLRPLADHPAASRAPPTGSTSRRSTSSRCRWSAMAPSSTSRRSSATTSISRLRALYNRRNSRTRRRRCRCSSAPTPATAICSTPSRSTSPTRSTRSATLAASATPAT